MDAQEKFWGVKGEEAKYFMFLTGNHVLIPWSSAEEMTCMYTQTDIKNSSVLFIWSLLTLEHIREKHGLIANTLSCFSSVVATNSVHRPASDAVPLLKKWSSLPDEASNKETPKL